MTDCSLEIRPIFGALGAEISRGPRRRHDTAYLEHPPMGTMPIVREVPPYGDTLFANMYLAYETLSAGMQRLIDGLIAVNSSAKADVTKTREDRIRNGARHDAKREYIAGHPVRRTHPETGRWENESLAFRDNRCAQHNPINDNNKRFCRVVHRATLAAR